MTVPNGRSGVDVHDPVLIEVLSSALSSVVEEMGETLVRASYSTNIKERRDCTASVFDSRGRMLAQDEGGSPLHLGSLMGIVDEITRRYPVDEIADGDMFIGNDPFTGGGSHLPDIVLASPVFVDGDLVAWVANLAHHADFGDRGHAHIYQEGLRIPPVRLLRRGELQTDLFDLILLNCQVPHERKADLRAQIAANRLAESRVTELTWSCSRSASCSREPEVCSGPSSLKLYPTPIRATGMSFVYNASRAIGALGPLVVGETAAAIGIGNAMITVAVSAAVVANVALWCLPETRGKDLADI